METMYMLLLAMLNALGIVLTTKYTVLWVIISMKRKWMIFFCNLANLILKTIPVSLASNSLFTTIYSVLNFLVFMGK